MTRPDWRAAPTQAQIDALRRRFPTEPRVDETLTRKMAARATPPYRPQSINNIRERLESYLAAKAGGTFSVENLRVLAGGSSKEQFAFTLQPTDGGATAPRHLVLRLEPPEGTVQTHRLREFQALEALQGHVPAPRPFWVDGDGSDFGAPMLIYEFREGVSRPPFGSEISGPQQGYGSHYTKLLGPHYVELLARIGTTPIDPAKLSAFVPPRPGTTDAALQALDWWQRVWEEDRNEAVPIMTLAAQWLRDNAPVTDHISLIHGDYRPGNFLFDLDSGAITTVLDWELVHLGDRHEDLTYCTNPLMGALDDKGELLVAGFYREPEYFARYAAASGLPIDPDRVRYFRIFNYWRQMIITYASSHRSILGRKTHQDLVVGMSAMVAGVVFQTLIDALEEVL